MSDIIDLFIGSDESTTPDDTKLDLSNNIAKFIDFSKEIEKNREIFVNYVTLIKSDLQHDIKLKTIRDYLVNHSDVIEAVRALLHVIIVLPDDSDNVDLADELNEFNFTTIKDDRESIEKAGEIIKRIGVKIDKLNINTIADELAPFILKSIETSFTDSFHCY
jgi:hypothetical protein